MRTNFKNILKELLNGQTYTENIGSSGSITYKKTFDKYVITNVLYTGTATPDEERYITNETNKLHSLEATAKRKTAFTKIILAAEGTSEEIPATPAPEVETPVQTPAVTQATTETPAPAPPAPPAPAPAPAAAAPNFGIDALIGGAVGAAIDQKTAQIESKVQAYLDANGIRPQTHNIVVTNTDTGTSVEVGQQHKKFEDILIMAKSRINPLLVGAPATGKSTLVENIAKALDMRFTYKALSSGTDPVEFFGFPSVTGEPTTTTFEDFYVNGGVFLIDEMDNGNPNTGAALNNALSSDCAPFASGLQKKHKDFICIGTANTYGQGATVDFVGRNPIDGATLDRFVIVTLEYDEQLEKSFTTNQEWVKTVQSFRKVAYAKKIRCFITPRATIYGSKLLANGMKPKNVIEYTIYKGMTKDERNLLKTAEIFV